MQATEAGPHTNWLQPLATFFGGILATGVAIFLTIILKRKTPSEVRESDANVHYSEAKTDDLKVTTGARIGEIVTSLAAKLSDTQIILGEMGGEIIELKEKVLERDQRILQKNSQIADLENLVFEQMAKIDTLTNENKAYERQQRMIRSDNLLKE